PITFRAEDENINDRRDSQDNFFWDFGSGATPAKATTTAIISYGMGLVLQDVTYATTGDKTVTLTVVAPGGCSETTTNEIHIYDCSIPSIPHDAIVINSNTTVAEG